MARYSEEFKEPMVRRMMPPNAPRTARTGSEQLIGSGKRSVTVPEIMGSDPVPDRARTDRVIVLQAGRAQSVASPRSGVAGVAEAETAFYSRR